MASRPHLLVTAGPTREAIDQVRDWGNIFTGQTGLDLAVAFCELGDVTLLTSNAAHAAQYDGYYGKGGMIGTETFRSHADLRSLLEERMTDHANPQAGVHVVAMSAAVADYSPQGTYRVSSRIKNPDGSETWTVQDVSAPKVKSTHDQIAVLGARTLKLIDEFRSSWKFTGLLIKFKLEVGLSDERLIEIAAASRQASQADLIVANTLEMARPSPPESGAAYLIDATTTSKTARTQLADAITAWVRARLSERAV